MSDSNPNAERQDVSFFKIWTDSFARLTQAAFTFSPEGPPPELLRQIRTATFQALAQSWDEFLRSPQFMENVKQMLDQGIAFRKMSTDLLTRARRDFGALGTEDLDGVVLTLRHMEDRVLERLEALSVQIAALEQRLERLENTAPPIPARRRTNQPRPTKKKTRAR